MGVQRLRAERQGLADRARTAIEELMRAEEYASVLQDRFFTIRAERSELPLTASAKSLGLGIVHDTSDSGSTLFVEPLVAVELGNAWREAQVAQQEEVERILDELSALVAATNLIGFAIFRRAR